MTRLPIGRTKRAPHTLVRVLLTLMTRDAIPPHLRACRKRRRLRRGLRLSVICHGAPFWGGGGGVQEAVCPPHEYNVIRILLRGMPKKEKKARVETKQPPHEAFLADQPVHNPRRLLFLVIVKHQSFFSCPFPFPFPVRLLFPRLGSGVVGMEISPLHIGQRWLFSYVVSFPGLGFGVFLLFPRFRGERASTDVFLRRAHDSNGS